MTKLPVAIELLLRHITPAGLKYLIMAGLMSGRSSGVEHNLAKVGVGRSNRLARSNDFNKIDYI